MVTKSHGPPSRVRGLGFRVQGLGFTIHSSGFRASGSRSSAITRIGHSFVMTPELVRVYNLRVQMPHNHILTQNAYYNDYYPKPKYLIIRYLDP